MRASSGGQNAFSAAAVVCNGAPCTACSPSVERTTCRRLLPAGCDEIAPEIVRAPLPADPVAVADLDQHPRARRQPAARKAGDRPGDGEDAVDRRRDGKPPSPRVGGVVQSERAAVGDAGRDDRQTSRGARAADAELGLAHEREARGHPVAEPTEVGRESRTRRGRLVAGEDHHAFLAEHEVVEPREVVRRRRVAGSVDEGDDAGGRLLGQDHPGLCRALPEVDDPQRRARGARSRRRCKQKRKRRRDDRQPASRLHAGTLSCGLRAEPAPVGRRAEALSCRAPLGQGPRPPAGTQRGEQAP